MSHEMNMESVAHRPVSIAPSEKSVFKGEVDATVLEARDQVARDVSGDVIDDGLRRGLKGRQFVMIALGSIIGPGTFYGLGYGLNLSGPLGLLLGFGVIGVEVWILMQGLGEVTTLFPIHGGFLEHGSRFVDPALSFATAWLYYLMWGFFLGSEANSATVILRFWVPETTVPNWGWVLIFWGILNVITTLGVGVYGEIEYFLTLFKLLACIVLFFISILANTGAFGNGYVGFRYWKEPYGPFRNGINGFGQVFVLAANYYVGTEIISLTAGESKNPRRDVPRGTRSIVYRILIVYVGTCFFQALICPSNSPELLSSTSIVASSPFTIGFNLAGWKSAGHLVNTIIIVTFISAANGCVYVMSRSLHSMAVRGWAPEFFRVTTARGVPLRSILFSDLFIFTMLMNLSLSAGTVFSYLNSICGTSAFIAWLAIMFTHLRVRAAARQQGIDIRTFPFKAPGSIYLYYTGFGVMVSLLLIQGFTAFENPFSWKTFITYYITLPTWFILFFGYKWYHGTHWVHLSEIDFSDRRQWIEDPSMNINDNRTFGRKVLDLFK